MSLLTIESRFRMRDKEKEKGIKLVFVLMCVWKRERDIWKSNKHRRQKTNK
jgi:hypothetical protein